MERYLPVNLLEPGPLLIKQEFTGPRSHKVEKHCTTPPQGPKLSSMSRKYSKIATYIDTSMALFRPLKLAH